MKTTNSVANLTNHLKVEFVTKYNISNPIYCGIFVFRIFSYGKWTYLSFIHRQYIVFVTSGSAAFLQELLLTLHFLLED